jgi:hypothetical protein
MTKFSLSRRSVNGDPVEWILACPFNRRGHIQNVTKCFLVARDNFNHDLHPCNGSRIVGKKRCHERSQTQPSMAPIYSRIAGKLQGQSCE